MENKARLDVLCITAVMTPIIQDNIYKRTYFDFVENIITYLVMLTPSCRVIYYLLFSYV